MCDRPAFSASFVRTTHFVELFTRTPSQRMMKQKHTILFYRLQLMISFCKKHYHPHCSVTATLAWIRGRSLIKQ